MKRALEIQNFIDEFTMTAFGRKMNDNVCVVCGSNKMSDEDFRNVISLKERDISRMCQKCQDKVWSNDYVKL